jgi:hypothetical protein
MGILHCVLQILWRTSLHEQLIVAHINRNIPAFPQNCKTCNYVQSFKPLCSIRSNFNAKNIPTSSPFKVKFMRIEFFNFLYPSKAVAQSV